MKLHSLISIVLAGLHVIAAVENWMHPSAIASYVMAIHAVVLGIIAILFWRTETASK